MDLSKKSHFFKFKNSDQGKKRGIPDNESQLEEIDLKNTGIYLEENTSESESFREELRYSLDGELFIPPKEFIKRQIKTSMSESNNKNQHDNRNQSDNKKVYLLEKRKIGAKVTTESKRNEDLKTGIVRSEFRAPEVNYKQWERKIKKPENINGLSKKSGVLFSLMNNKIDFRVRKEFRKMILTLSQKYKENKLFLDEMFCQSLVNICVEFTKTMKMDYPNKKVFMRPLFVSVSYALLREECKDNAFLIELRDIMRFLSLKETKHFRTKMVLFYLKEFKTYRNKSLEENLRKDRRSSKEFQTTLLSKRQSLSTGSLENESESELNSENYQRLKKETRADQRRLKQMFRVKDTILNKFIQQNHELDKKKKEINDWVNKILFFDPDLRQNLLCKKVKNVGLAVLFLAFSVLFPFQEMNLTDFLQIVNSKNQNDEKSKRNKILFCLVLLSNYYQFVILY